MNKRRLSIIILIVLLLLLIPFIAMQFTDEVHWTLMDFIIAGVLLLSTWLVFDLLTRKIKNTKYRIVLSVVLLIVFLLIWTELAVGIFNTPLSGS